MASCSFLMPAKDHLGAGDLGVRILDVFLEVLLVPDDARILVRVGIVEPAYGAGLAAVEAVEHGADFVLRARADGMARQALLERIFACRRRPAPLRPRGRGDQRSQPPATSSFSWHVSPSSLLRPHSGPYRPRGCIARHTCSSGPGSACQRPNSAGSVLFMAASAATAFPAIVSARMIAEWRRDARCRDPMPPCWRAAPRSCAALARDRAGRGRDRGRARNAALRVATGSPPIASCRWWWCCRRRPSRSPRCCAIATTRASRWCRAARAPRSRAARCRSPTACCSAWPSSTASARSISTTASRWSSRA